MKTSTRRRLGVVVVITSLVAVLALYLSGKPLISLTSWQTKTTASGAISMTVGVIRVWWPLLATCGAGFLGLIAIVWPQQRPPRLQQ